MAFYRRFQLAQAEEIEYRWKNIVLGDEMSNPRFSIVIPTRNRHTTLKYALLTCINQKNFGDYEIIVCDNCSSPETKKTVERFESEKIKYIRSDWPLAMSQNWELAVSHAEGEYVIVIGDDDGLLINALYKIDQLLRIFGTEVLRWQRVNYYWPDYPKDKNRLVIPLVWQNRIMQSREIISKAANLKVIDWELPQLYNSAVHRDIIALLRKKTGRVFAATSPDLYSGFAFAYLSGSYLSVGLPMSISGGSKSSNGFANLASKNNPIAHEFNLLNEKAHIRCHPQVPDIPVASAAIADSFLHAKDALFPCDSNISINRKRLVINCLRDLSGRYCRGVDNEEDWRMYLGKIRDSLADDVSLQKWFDSKFKDSKADDVCIGWFDQLVRLNRRFIASISQESQCSYGFKKGFNGKEIILDAADFGLTDVFGVAEFCENFYSPKVDALEWHGQGVKPDLLIRMKKIRSKIGGLVYRYA